LLDHGSRPQWGQRTRSLPVSKNKRACAELRGELAESASRWRPRAGFDPRDVGIADASSRELALSEAGLEAKTSQPGAD
jgi:hypothetical protein